MFFFLSICCFNRFSRFRFGHCYLIHVRSRLGTPPTLSVGEGDLGDRAVWCAIIFELYRCVDHRSFVDTSASPWKTRSRSRRWKKQVFFLILYHDVFVVFFFFFVYRFCSRSIHRIDRGGVSQNRDHCMRMTGFVIVYTVNSELKRNSIR